MTDAERYANDLVRAAQRDARLDGEFRSPPATAPEHPWWIPRPGDES